MPHAPGLSWTNCIHYTDSLFEYLIAEITIQIFVMWLIYWGKNNYMVRTDYVIIVQIVFIIAVDACYCGLFECTSLEQAEALGHCKWHIILAPSPHQGMDQQMEKWWQWLSCITSQRVAKHKLFH